jgi:transposase
VVRRRQLDSGVESGRGGREKGGSQEPKDHALGRSRGGFGSKIHLVADSGGIPLAAHVTAGQAHESKHFEGVVNRVRIRQPLGRARTRPGAIAGDKGYSYPAIRRWLRRHAIRAVIPRRSDQRPEDGRVKFDLASYRKRCTVEQCTGWLKECRHIGTRFDKLAVNFLAMIHLAFIERYLRILFSDGA